VDQSGHVFLKITKILMPTGKLFHIHTRFNCQSSWKTWVCC